MGLARAMISVVEIPGWRAVGGSLGPGARITVLGRGFPNGFRAGVLERASVIPYDVMI
jgi:hypothetical protein